MIVQKGGVAVDGLTIRQEAFCMAYAKSGNATEAYKQAGYKVKTDKAAGVNAARLLGNARIKARLKEIGEQTNTSKVLSIQQRKELLTEFATDSDTAKADRLKAVDILNKMDAVYIQKQDVNMSGGVVILHDDVPAED